MPEYGDKHPAADDSGYYFYTGHSWDFKTTLELDTAGGLEAYEANLKKQILIYESDIYRLIFDPVHDNYEIRKYQEEIEKWELQSVYTKKNANLVPLLEFLNTIILELAFLKSLESK